MPTIHGGYWALVLKYRATSIHSTDQISIALDQIQTKQYIYRKRAFEDRIKFWKKSPILQGLRNAIMFKKEQTQTKENHELPCKTSSTSPTELIGTREIWMKFWIILGIRGWGISCEIALRWMSLYLIDDTSTLVQVMAWCRQATSHYRNQCWPDLCRHVMTLGLNELNSAQHLSLIEEVSMVTETIEHLYSLEFSQPAFLSSVLVMIQKTSVTPFPNMVLL